VGLGQARGGIPEAPLVTAGNEVADLARLVTEGQDSYAAADVIRYLRSTEVEWTAPIKVQRAVDREEWSSRQSAAGTIRSNPEHPHRDWDNVASTWQET
jgi:hypothetical protein